MHFQLALAFSAALLATAAAPQAANTGATRQKFEGVVSDWQYALGHEDGVVIEKRASRGVSKALFIRLEPGNFQVADTISTSGLAGEGHVSSRTIAELITRSEPFDGYRYSCRCFDGVSVAITIARSGKTTRLYAYGPLDGEKGPAASVIRAWEMIEDKVDDGR
jgi:hypothetical protein